MAWNYLMSSDVQGSGSSRVQAAIRRMQEMALAAFIKAYPFIHMAQEGLTFSYQLAYLLQSSPYFSPTLHVLGQHVVRTSAQELVGCYADLCQSDLQRAAVFLHLYFPC